MTTCTTTVVVVFELLCLWSWVTCHDPAECLAANIVIPICLLGLFPTEGATRHGVAEGLTVDPAASVWLLGVTPTEGTTRHGVAEGLTADPAVFI